MVVIETPVLKNRPAKLLKEHIVERVQREGVPVSDLRFREVGDRKTRTHCYEIQGREYHLSFELTFGAKDCSYRHEFVDLTEVSSGHSFMIEYDGQSAKISCDFGFFPLQDILQALKRGDKPAVTKSVVNLASAESLEQIAGNVVEVQDPFPVLDQYLDAFLQDYRSLKI